MEEPVSSGECMHRELKEGRGRGSCGRGGDDDDRGGGDSEEARFGGGCAQQSFCPSSSGIHNHKSFSVRIFINDATKRINSV